MNIIVFDFEVFKYDTLLGINVIHEDGDITTIQSWNLDEIKQLYLTYVDDFWIGHNNKHYDNIILSAIVTGKTQQQIRAISKDIVNGTKNHKSRIKLKYYDLMMNGYFSLKLTEGAAGKNISESKVDFDIDRPLTLDEKLLVESYNRDDLEQTTDNLLDENVLGYMKCRLEILNEFNLPIEYLTVTETQIGAAVLGAKKIPGIENWLVKPHMYDNLKLNNKDLLEFYFNEDFRKHKKKTIMVCGTPHIIGAGGIHAAIPKYHTDKALYFDVSGYYNLTMINYDLLPRTLDADAREKYINLYYKQLEYKKTDPLKRWALKVVLLAVFGSMNNEFTDFYDPQRCLMVTITGQLFIVDLLEKLEGLVRVIQSNTDGIIVEPFDWNDKDKIISIVEEWEKRTKYTIKKDMIYDIWQRDVNCYFYRDDKGEIHCKGEAVKDYDNWQSLFAKNVFESQEPPIIAQCIVDYFLFNKSPEETIMTHKNTLRMFQYLCKKKSFDYTTYEETFSDGHIEITRLQGINRAFAYNSCNSVGVVYKHKPGGKTEKARVPKIPDNVFVYDNDIRSDDVVVYLSKKIDYNYYIKRGYERIMEFVNIPIIKDIKL